MAPRINSPQCLRKSPFGRCNRTAGHSGVHASFIGDRAFWYGWRTPSKPLGYGYFNHGRFEPKIPVKGAA